MSGQEEEKQTSYLQSATALMGSAVEKASAAKEAYGPSISEKFGQLKLAGYTGAQNAYASYMARSETKQQPNQNFNSRASISAPIKVQDDDEIEQSVTAKATAVWGGLMGAIQKTGFTAPKTKPEKEQSSESEGEGKDDKPSGDGRLPLPEGKQNNAPRDSFAGADEAPEDDEGSGATVPKVGGLEVARKNLIPTKIEVVEEESKKIGENEALELTPGVFYFGDLMKIKPEGSEESIWVQHGEGTANYKEDKSTYTGSWVRGRRQGYGKCKWEDGREYQGNWTDDMREGLGLFKWPGKRQFDGGWKDNQQHGFGFFTNVNGLTRNGEWKNGQRQRWVGPLDDGKYNNLINDQYTRTEPLEVNAKERPSCEPPRE